MTEHKKQVEECVKALQTLQKYMPNYDHNDVILDAIFDVVDGDHDRREEVNGLGAYILNVTNWHFDRNDQPLPKDYYYNEKYKRISLL